MMSYPLMSVTTYARKPYCGNKRSLVLAFDVGATFSGVSYAILEPNEIPKIYGVTRFPGKEHVTGSYKIPTIMYYDREGNMKAGGAETEDMLMASLAEDNGWTKVELFKPQLWPQTMKLKMNGMCLPPLPKGKSAMQVFGDYLGYLFRCAKNFIIDTHAGGASLWRAVEEDLRYILTHPNGWEGARQAKMQRAAVYGGLIPDTDAGKARIQFVTEGEASLHAYILSGLASETLTGHPEHVCLVTDAGEGTLNISSYAVWGTTPPVTEEIAPPDFVFAGPISVSRRARAFFEDKLRGSKYGTQDSVEHITKCFDETTKLLFCDKKDAQYVQFGSFIDMDRSVGIYQGQVELTGTEVAEFFEPSIETVIDSIKEQVDFAGGFVKSIWLVGVFAASPWFYSQLQERLPHGITVSRADNQTSVVADGAIGFYCDQYSSISPSGQYTVPSNVRWKLERYRSDSTKLAIVYRTLVRDLEEAKGALRSRDKQIEELKRERDRRFIRDLSHDKHVDVFEEASFNDRHPIIIVENEGVPGKEKPEGAGQVGEFDPEKVLGNNDLTEGSILITEALRWSIPPIEFEAPPTPTNTELAPLGPLPNATPLPISDTPAQPKIVPSPIISTNAVANAAAAAFAPYRHGQHQFFQPKQRRQRANVVRAGPKKTGTPVSGPVSDLPLMDDHNEENVNNIHEEEGFDNCPWDPVNIDDNGNHGGPRSTKSLSKYSSSTAITGSLASP